MDDKRYAIFQERKFLEYEALCRRCGACCGVRDGDPCEHLKKDHKGLYFCDIYDERFGLRKTVSGEPVLCVPIRNMLHKTWWGSAECAYIRKGLV